MPDAYPHHNHHGGKAFTDRRLGLRKRAATGTHEFDTLCATLDIEHRPTPPKSPQTDGMVERFNARIGIVAQRGGRESLGESRR